MPLPYIPPQAYDQELADAFRVRYQLADQRSIQRLRSMTGYSLPSSYTPRYGNMVHNTHAYPPSSIPNRLSADVMCYPQYQPIPTPVHPDFIDRSPYYPPIPPGNLSYLFVTNHRGTPPGLPVGYAGTWPPPACPTWPPADNAFPAPLSSPPHPSTFRGATPSSPSSTSQSSVTYSEVSNTPEPEPLLTAEEFVQTLHRLELDGRGEQAPIARFRLRGEPMHVSVSRPQHDGPFVIRHYDSEGREDGISVAHILPAQGGVMWCPPPRIHYPVRNSSDRGT